MQDPQEFSLSENLQSSIIQMQTELTPLVSDRYKAKTQKLFAEVFGIPELYKQILNHLNQADGFISISRLSQTSMLQNKMVENSFFGKKNREAIDMLTFNQRAETSKDCSENFCIIFHSTSSFSGAVGLGTMSLLNITECNCVTALIVVFGFPLAFLTGAFAGLCASGIVSIPAIIPLVCLENYLTKKIKTNQTEIDNIRDKIHFDFIEDNDNEETSTSAQRIN